MSTSIEPVSPPASAADLAGLGDLLRDAVEGGASVGFMLPLPDAEVRAYWTSVYEEIGSGGRILLTARDAGRIVGSVQLALAGKPNALHRAEVQKLLVHRTHRGRGLGTALLQAAEMAAQSHRRSLLVLDTSATGNALGLYTRCGYTRAGVIPRYARDPDGPFIDTVIYYKELARP